MEQKTITTEAYIKDELGQEFKAEITFEIDELNRHLDRVGYKLVRKE